MLFGYNFDKRTLYIIMGLLILAILINLGANNIIGMLLTLPGVILAISFHEFAHAFAAVKLGDPTPKNQGRLTLDPLKHLDPAGIFLLIFAHIGWGKPVQINPNNFSKVSKAKGETIVAIAGPLMNFFLALILLIIFYLIMIFVPNSGIIRSVSGVNVLSVVITLIYYAIVVNVGLGVFNLIPIPPLDGSKVFLQFLPYRAQMWIQDKLPIISIIFLVLCLTGLLGYVTGPVIEAIMYGMQYLVSLIFSIFI